MFDNTSILVTGGTGFFGINFIKYILKLYSPKRLIIFSRDEFKQYMIKQAQNDERIEYCIGDIRDATRLEYVLKGIDYVVHTASMKHINIAELNPTECIQTNIIGTENLIKACIKNKVKKVIGLSTDKAVIPINLYGATKLILEKLFMHADLMHGNETMFSIVRYGNVIGSRGSVLPFFKKLIAEDAEELPITHPDMTRFWLPINNAIKVVIEAFKKGNGGEIFIPKAPSIKITDLAKSLAPHLPVKLIGMRTGEKIHETLFTSDELNLFNESIYYFIIPNLYLPKHHAIRNNAIDSFNYSSNNNTVFLSTKDIDHFNKQNEYFINEYSELPSKQYTQHNLETAV